MLQDLILGFTINAQQSDGTVDLGISDKTVCGYGTQDPILDPIDGGVEIDTVGENIHHYYMNGDTIIYPINQQGTGTGQPIYISKQ